MPTAVPSKRDAILDAALVVFVESAYGSTTMPAIARQAGVADGTTYRYFPSKESLANALYQREKQAMLHALVDVVALGLDPASELRATWGALWALYSERPKGVEFLETQQHSAYLDGESRDVARQVDECALAIISRGQAAGVVRSGDPGALLAMVFGAFVGLARMHAPAVDRLDQLTWPAIAGLLSLSEGS